MKYIVPSCSVFGHHVLVFLKEKETMKIQLAKYLGEVGKGQFHTYTLRF